MSPDVYNWIKDNPDKLNAIENKWGISGGEHWRGRDVGHMSIDTRFGTKHLAELAAQNKDASKTAAATPATPAPGLKPWPTDAKDKDTKTADAKPDDKDKPADQADKKKPPTPAPVHHASRHGRRRMAKGGIVTKPTDITAGEDGDEAIVPLDDIAGIGGKKGQGIANFFTDLIKSAATETIGHGKELAGQALSSGVGAVGVGGRFVGDIAKKTLSSTIERQMPQAPAGAHDPMFEKIDAQSRAGETPNVATPVASLGPIRTAQARGRKWADHKNYARHTAQMATVDTGPT